jgi:hypothetical protein
LLVNSKILFFKGFGLDSHRYSEAILMRAIPIVQIQQGASLRIQQGAY